MRTTAATLSKRRKLALALKLHTVLTIFGFSEYKKVPDLPEDTIRELPNIVRNIRRTRSDSVGPQSEADAYETIAYREKQRRESISKGTVPVLDENPIEDENTGLDGDLGPTDERAVFEMIERPRVRYDVEVVTKLVVYFGEFGILCGFRLATDWLTISQELLYLRSSWSRLYMSL